MVWVWIMALVLCSLGWFLAGWFSSKKRQQAGATPSPVTLSIEEVNKLCDLKQKAKDDGKTTTEINDAINDFFDSL